MPNIFSSLPDDLTLEAFEQIINSNSVKIERIVSKGHTSPESGGWYDQEENEWVIVLQGSARLMFEDGRELCLSTGDHINIPAHAKHRVSWTDPDNPTIWLAVFYL